MNNKRKRKKKTSKEINKQTKDCIIVHESGGEEYIEKQNTDIIFILFPIC
jgi:hypothetical protein